MALTQFAEFFKALQIAKNKTLFNFAALPLKWNMLFYNWTV